MKGRSVTFARCRKPPANHNGVILTSKTSTCSTSHRQLLSINDQPHPPASTMPALANATRAIARSWTAHQLPAVRAGCTAMQTRSASASSFDSPFKSGADTTKIPSFAAYRNKGGEAGPKMFQYFMVGTMGALSAMGAKNTVQGTYTDITPANGSSELPNVLE